MNCTVEEIKYFVYARRDQNEQWSNWSGAKSIDDAIKRGENAKRFGFEAKVVEIIHREVEI